MLLSEENLNRQRLQVNLPDFDETLEATTEHGLVRGKPEPEAALEPRLASLISEEELFGSGLVAESLTSTKVGSGVEALPRLDFFPTIDFLFGWTGS